MNIGNITSDNFNLDGNGKDIQIEVYEQLIEQLQQENQELKAINEQHRKINGKLREENQKYKEVIDKAIEYMKDFIFEPLLTNEDRKLIMYNDNLRNFEKILKEVE